MTKPSRKYIENIKNVTMVVLFLTAVLLFYLFSQNDSLNAFQFPDMSALTEVRQTPEEPVEIRDIIQPEEIAVYQGNGMYKVVQPYSHAFWQDTLTQLVAFSNGQNILVQEITEEAYQEVKNLRYIQYRFNYSIPFAQFCEYYGLRKNSAYDNVSRFTILLYTEEFGDSLFVADTLSETKKYYRLISDNVEEAGEGVSILGEQIRLIETGNYPDYRTIGELVGPADNPNERLLPLSYLTTTMKPFSYTQEDSGEESIQARALAVAFFGNSLDFVRTTVDRRGATIYTYDGYRKIYTMGADGTFEYREAAQDGASTTRFFEGLQSALDFHSQNSSWSTYGGSKTEPYLDNAEVIEVEGRRGYRFTFGFRLNGDKVYYEDSAPLVVEVVGAQVIYYKRNMIEFAAAQYEELKTAPAWQTAETPLNVLARNSDQIIEKENELRLLREEEPMAMDFETMTREIVYLKTGYLRLREVETDENPLRNADDPELIPVWVLKTFNYIYYIHLADPDVGMITAVELS